jgi:hypothetical protein
MTDVDAALHSQFEVLFGRVDPPCARTAQAAAEPAVARMA